MQQVTLGCPHCNWQAICNQAEVEHRLRGLGLLRRAPHPPGELVAELLNANLSRLSCDACGNTGIVLARDHEDNNDDDRPSDDWQQAIVCEVCKKLIPPERVEIFPDARRCVDCQGLADRGEEPQEPDFCPKCGSLVELRVSRGTGITRYKRFCTGSPACRL